MSSQKIFFSYSRADSPFALQLAKDLREAGADIWIDQLDIPAGSHWDAAVEKALNSSAFVLVILTPSSTASTNVMDEVSFALESGKKIIPVLMEDCLPPFRLRRLQRIDFTSDYDAGFSQLILSLNLSISSEEKSGGIPAEQFHLSTTTPLSPPEDTHGHERRDNLLWEEACKMNTIASYKKYLHESPAGLFREEAMLMISQLEVEQKQDELEALLWKKTKTGHVKNLYAQYLQEYPQGNYKTLALAAIAEFEKEEQEEAKRLQAIVLQQEKEKAQREKEEREKQLALEKAKAQKEKEEKEKQLAREKEAAEKARVEKERLAQIEKEKAQKEKEEREKQLALQKEAAEKARVEKERLAQIEKEKAQKEKAEREKQLQLEREKAKREKEAQEKIRQQEKEKALLAKKQEKERIALERKAKGLPPEPEGQVKKYAMIGGGVLILCLAIWLIAKPGSGADDRSAWKEAQAQNDSTAFAKYMSSFPEGKYYVNAKQRIDSLYWANKTVKDSLEKIAVAEVTTPAPQESPETPQESPETSQASAETPTASTEVQKDPVKKTVPQAKPKASTPAPAKPKTKTSSATISLGQEYGGGIVIYVNPAGTHGMIVSSKEVSGVNWEKAQKICAASRDGDYQGWRLPSKDELNIIYQNRKYLGPYTKGNYWSGTEEGKNSAMVQNFANGNDSKSNKQSDNAMRAVRPF